MGGLRPAARNVALSRSFYLKIRNTACHDAAIRVVLGGVRCHVLRRRSRTARQLVSVRVHHALQLVHLRPQARDLCAQAVAGHVAGIPGLCRDDGASTGLFCARPSTPAVHPSRTRSVALLAPAAPKQTRDVHDRSIYDRGGTVLVHVTQGYLQT